MAQLALHGWIGSWLAARRYPGPRRPGSPEAAYKTAVVWGSLAPDADLALELPLYPFNPRVATSLHRTWSHSWLLQPLWALLLERLAAGREEAPPAPEVRRQRYGALLAGMGVHSATDIAVWFSPVALLWPLRLLGVPDQVDLWEPVRGRLPVSLGNLLGALEHGSWAAWLAWLAARAEPGRARRQAGLAAGLSFAAFAAMALLAGRMSRQRFDVVNYGVVMPALLPWQLRALKGLRRVLESL
ncbi:MAG: metal-dependent hydrolase [Bacillota bacterium]|nr:metal-dependent hydrolase [Bacillota bacterium]